MGISDRDYMRESVRRPARRPVRAPFVLKIKFFFWRLFRFLRGKARP